MSRVQRAESTESTGEVPLVCRTPSELDRRAPDRIVGVAEAPGRREHRREIVRVVVMTRAVAACAADRVSEASRVGEAGPRRIADVGRRPWIEIAEDSPEQDMTREVERLLERIVGGRFVG